MALRTGAGLDAERRLELLLHLPNMGDEEDLGEMGLLRPKRPYEVGPPLLVLASEDLVEDEDGCVLGAAHLGEVPGEGDPQGDGDIVLFSAGETVGRIVGTHVVDQGGEVLIDEDGVVAAIGDLAEHLTDDTF